MKRILFLPVFILVCSTILAEDTIPVTLIKKDGSQLECLISAYEGKIISDFTFTIWIGDEKLKVERSDLKSIITDSSKYEMVAYNYETRQGSRVITKKVKRMSEVLVYGDVQLYAAYSVGSNSGSAMPGGAVMINSRTYLVTQYYLVSNEISSINRTTFKKKIKEFFSECDNLISKVKSKELKYRDIEEVVRIGNNCK